MSNRTAKPIRVFYDRLRGRFYASARYSTDPSGFVTITGKKHDVTNDIGRAMIKYGLNFRPAQEPTPQDPAPEVPAANPNPTESQEKE